MSVLKLILNIASYWEQFWSIVILYLFLLTVKGFDLSVNLMAILANFSKKEGLARKIAHRP